MIIDTEKPCPICGDENLPIDDRFDLCWACLPCYCGDGCGFSIRYGHLGIKTCEDPINDIERENKLAKHLD